MAVSFDHFLKKLPGPAFELPPDLRAAELLSVRISSVKLVLTLTTGYCPQADDLIDGEKQLSDLAGLPVYIQLRPRGLSEADQGRCAQQLFPWFVEHLTHEDATLSILLRACVTQSDGPRLSLLLPEEQRRLLRPEHFIYMNDFYQERAGLAVRCGLALAPSGAGANGLDLSAQRSSRLQSAYQQLHTAAEVEAKEEMQATKNGNGQKTPRTRSFYRTKAAGHLWGRYSPEITNTPLGALDGESGVVHFSGYIAAFESRLISDDTRALLKFIVHDEDGAVNCVLFCKLEEQELLEELLNPESQKAYLSVEAEVSYDGRFTKDLQGRVIGLSSAERPASRQDLAPVKRVELHCHTKMSAKDAVADCGKIIRLAASFGHPAVAITDHGVVQSFPEACQARDRLAKEGKPIKIIYGVESYLVDDGPTCVFGIEPLDWDGQQFVALDLETTGLDPADCSIIEVGAVRYRRDSEGRWQQHERFDSLVNPGVTLPEKIVQLTGIHDLDLVGAPDTWSVLRQLHDFLGDDPIVGHNILFDLAFLRYGGFNTPEVNAPRLKFNPIIIDTLPLARHELPGKSGYKLSQLAAALGIDSGRQHRALDDAITSAELFIRLYQQAGEPSLPDLNARLGHIDREILTASKTKVHHLVLLVKDQVGLYNLYRLISESHTRYFRKRPRMPRSLLTYFRAGLLVGAACEAGEIFSRVKEVYTAANHDFALASQQIRSPENCRLAYFYDYLEIQPLGNNRFMVHEPGSGILNETDLMNLNRLVLVMGDAARRPVAATGDTHFIDQNDSIYRQILQSNMGFEDAEQQADLYFRTTDEMLAEFAYLTPEQQERVVLTTPRAIAAQVEDGLRPFPEGTYPPVIPEAAAHVEEMTWNAAQANYGCEGELPELVSERVTRELASIIGNGYAVMYYISATLVAKSNADGYIVGSRGSVGSSLVAYFCGITEVNPLPPHYVCPLCHHAEFDTSGTFGSGYDLPPSSCPQCGTAFVREGQDIPFETFLGFDGDKEPDIDLNFSSEYQPVAHKFIEGMFGSDHTYRAGTINGYAEKNAMGLVRGYYENIGEESTEANKRRLAQGLIGVKRTTGQHPGGIVIIPKEREVYDFTPIQFPADKTDSAVTTTHFDFNSMHDTILKLDILGHDDPTMLKVLSDDTGVKISDIPIPDEKVMSLFESTAALDLPPGSTPADSGTLGLPELGTFMARDMIKTTRPTKFYNLVQLMGLSHGTGVWKGNAEDLILNDTASIDTVIGCRDGIMTTLIYYGLPKKAAFDIMERVRKKNQQLSPEDEDLMREHHVPEWYIDSCRKIEYMFPKAHAAAYTISCLRIAWFKVYRPAHYYAAYFTVRADEFDCDIMCGDLEHTIAERERLRSSFGGRDENQREQKQYYIIELVEEMLYRGIRFAPIDLYRSQAAKFVVEEDHLIRPPFNAIPAISRNIGEALAAAREDGEGEFLSAEDLNRRANVGQAAIDNLRRHDVLGDLPDSAQLDFFSLLDMA